MAEKTRSQSLQEQLDRLLAQAPKPYTAEEIKQIEKGRKGQKEIDEGRATIERRNEEVRKAQDQIDKLNEQIGRAIEFETNTASKSQESQERSAKDAEKRSMYGLGLTAASGGVAPIAGWAMGRAMGGGINKLADKAQEFKNRSLQGAAEDRLRGVTTREGARIGTERSGAMPSPNSVVRVSGRMLPHLISGAGMGAKGALMLSQVKEDDPLEMQALNRGLGLGMLGAGVGIAERGAAYGIAPGVTPDARAISIMESNQLRRGGLDRAVDKGPVTAQTLQPDQEALPAPKKEFAPDSVEGLRAQLKAMNVKGYSRMNKTQAAEALAKAILEKGKTRAKPLKLPKGGGAAALAGGLAYAATPDEAQAADGSSMGGQGRALTNAGLAGATAYGASRLMDKLPSFAGAYNAGGPAMSAQSIDSMTDYSPEDIAQFNEFARKTLPEWMVPKAAYMGQVPERNPARPTPGMFGDMPEDQELQAAMEAFLAEAQQ